MKLLPITVSLLLSATLITSKVEAAKETFDRTKPHMAALAEIDKACKTDKKQCADLKKAYKKKYSKDLIK